MTAARMTTILALLLLTIACSPSAPPAAPAVTDAWIREAPPSAGMTAGYLTVTNPTDADIEIVDARSEAFDSIEFHITVNEDGMARMRREPSVTVPARGRVDFTPGGRHLMLFGAKSPLSDGDAVDLTITLADGRALEVSVPVARGGQSGHDHHNH